MTTKTKAKITAYNVYLLQDGCCEEFCGRARTLAAARKLTRGRRLAEHLYETAEAAGSYDGMYAPDKDGEDESDMRHLRGDFYAVPVRGE